ncbi:ABC transporter permease [Mycoplasmopsis agassizii]|uniref:ABC transporter permease n=1 Tax=Mycoplasmopsis agassizii TaxID=33922 RepID=A0ABX4H6Q4_9BACT|nr:hypothetical protein [Mycoplasmopsis agassizii]PAF55532.1 hypothetical protein CJF60_02545 [Mycoplasmopsis agassizii]SMC17941.1 ABC-type transport system involved in multi-copper enzyme maturation, permease component [Mycoplasmopsis agassizii]
MLKYMKTTFNFMKFLNIMVFSKWFTYVFVIISFFITMFFVLMPYLFSNSDSYRASLLMIVPVMFILLLTIIYAIYISVLLFRDTENNGLDLVIAAKPIERMQIVIAKYIYFILFAFVWAIVIYIATSIASIPLRNVDYFKLENVEYFVHGSFAVVLFAFVFFGLITALIAKKINKAVAYLFSVVIFLPLFFIGTVAPTFSRPQISSFTSEYNNLRSESAIDAANLFAYSTSDQEDGYYIVPTNSDGSLTQSSRDFLNRAFQNTKTSPVGTQVLSWIDIPYQMGIHFAANGRDFFMSGNALGLGDVRSIFNNFGTENVSTRYNYHLVANEGLVTDSSNKSVVMNLPLLTSQNSLFREQTQRNIYYAWENAESDTLLTDDSFSFTNTANYYGTLDWRSISELIQNDDIKAAFKKFNDKYLTGEDLTSRQYLDALFAEYDSIIPDFLNVINNSFTQVTDRYLVQLQMQYYVVALYYLYLNYQNNSLLKNVLFENGLANHQFEVKVNYNGETRNYKIGGYSNATQVQQTVNNQTVNRVQLTAGDDFLFSTVENYYKFERALDTQPQYSVGIYWTIIIVALSAAVIYIYYRREY